MRHPNHVASPQQTGYKLITSNAVGYPTNILIGDHKYLNPKPGGHSQHIISGNTEELLWERWAIIKISWSLLWYMGPNLRDKASPWSTLPRNRISEESSVFCTICSMHQARLLNYCRYCSERPNWKSGGQEELLVMHPRISIRLAEKQPKQQHVGSLQ